MIVERKTNFLIADLIIQQSSFQDCEASGYMIRGHFTFLFNIRVCWSSLDSVAPPSELLEMCEQSLEEMGAVFHDSNVYMLHMMYQAMGVCLYMQDLEGAVSYGEKILKPYRCDEQWTVFIIF